jgi:S-formylglutathione hydrolase FrmB
LAFVGLAAVSVNAAETPIGNAGRVVNAVVSSPSLANLFGAPARTRVSVYLPPSYATSPRARYPVVYLLHGFGASEEMWAGARPKALDVPALMDSLVAAGAVREMIVVMPDAEGPLGGSFYTNSVATGQWDDFISRDLVAWTDSAFRTLASPESRGLAGHSMGGYGSVYLGMRHGGETYGAVYAMAPCCTGRLAFVPARDGAAWDSAASLASVAAVMRSGFAPWHGITAISAAFAPDASRPPLFYDAAEVRHGDRWVANDSVIARWDAHSPILMIPRYRANLLRLRALQFDGGLQDQAVPPRDLMSLDSALTRAGVPHRYEAFDGAHVGRVGDRLVTRVLPFFSRNLVFEQRRK